ncbi:MAG: hypothetical protein IKS90_01820 [Clostridia bacterium]|nr:hypothetical protein [Clostridia bacterium]
MSNKENWKDAGKGIGKSFLGLGKALLKTARKGIDEVLDDKPEGEENTESLKDSWKEVGQTFGNTGKAFGKAVVGTASTVVDSLEKEVNDIDEKKVEEMIDAEVEEVYDDIEADAHKAADEVRAAFKDLHRDFEEAKADFEDALDDLKEASDGEELKDYKDPADE